MLNLFFSLSKFLKLSNSLIQILNVPMQLTTRLFKIEANFSVVSVLYKKYETIFKNVFNHSFEYLIEFFANSQHHIDNKIESKDFFIFGWLLFINIKSIRLLNKNNFLLKVKTNYLDQYPQISNDLVNSYHLLICCVNYMYQNIENLNQEYLLRISISRKNGLKHLKFNKFIDYICKKYDGNSVEIKTVNEYYFRPQMENLFPNKSDNIELLDSLCYKLEQNYEKILNRKDNATNTENSINLDIDERVFLNKLESHSHNLSIAESEKVWFSINVPDCLKTINDFSIHGYQSKSYYQKFEFQKILDLFKTLFINDAMKNVRVNYFLNINN